MPKKRGHGKYTSEVEKIRMLRSLNSMMKTSDMENALLSNSARDSETVSDSVVDDMLSKISAERGRDIQEVEKITAYSMGHGRAPQRLPRETPRRRAKPARKRGAKPARRPKPSGKKRTPRPKKPGRQRRRR